MHKKRHGLVFGKNNQRGFTLIELLIAIALIALLAAIVIPNLGKLSPRYEREQFIARLNALVQLTWRNAVTTHKIHKVAFDFDQRIVSVAIATDQFDREGEPIFKPLKGQYMSTTATIPENLAIKQFILEGFDEMARFAGKKTAEVWFYVVPEGLSQEVIINLVDTKDTVGGKSRQVGLVLNPFNAQFKIYDTFQK